MVQSRRFVCERKFPTGLKNYDQTLIDFSCSCIPPSCSNLDMEEGEKILRKLGKIGTSGKKEESHKHLTTCFMVMI